MMHSSSKDIGKRYFLNSTFLLFAISISFTSFAQRKKKVMIQVQYPVVRVIEKDSVMIFTLEQTKELAKINEERLKLLSNVRITNSQLKFKDSIIRMQETQIFDLKLVKFDYDEIVKQMQRQQKAFIDEKAILNREVKRQRRQKYASIGSGILSFGTLLYFYIHK
jgi:hypothetical protein